VFGDNGRFRFLMFFFHVMKHIQERIKLFSSRARARVLIELYDLHFARTEEHYSGMLRAILTCWMADPALVPFAQYFYGQWVTGPFATWQAFATPSGFASGDFQRDVETRLRAPPPHQNGHVVARAERVLSLRCARHLHSRGGCPRWCASDF
jgi:hypothetical protein